LGFSFSPHAKACAQVGAPLLGAAIGLYLIAIIIGVGHQRFTGPDSSAPAFAAAAQSGYAAADRGQADALTSPQAWGRPAKGRDLDCLTDAVYYEARGESADGQAAVAQVVLNRARHPDFPKSVCAVVFQPREEGGCQFSFACDGSMARPLEPTAWREARFIAARALGGYVMTAVGRALDFHVSATGRERDAQPGTVARLGHHVFFVAEAETLVARRMVEMRRGEPAPAPAPAAVEEGAEAPAVAQGVALALGDMGVLRGKPAP
jgi:spore germination cell wall hydrolase CwlJ-like protein